MNNKSHKQKQLKRKCGHDALGILFKGPQLSKKQKRRLALANKKYKMSWEASSSSRSTTSSKDALKEDGTEDFSKLQCDMCKLSYGCKDKLVEHLVSLMHHTKLEESGKDSNHRCILCDKSFGDMASYRDHIGTNKHLRKLEMLRGIDKEKQDTIQNLQHKSHNRRENSTEFQEPRYQYPGPHNQFFNHNAGWQQQNYPRRQNYEHFQNPFYQNHFGPFPQGMPRFNNCMPQQFYGGKPNNNGRNSQNYMNRWDRHYIPGKNRMEFESGNNGGINMPWGSGITNYKNVKAYNNNFNNFNADFAQDNFCWDEQSFKQHEDFLANIDQGCQRDSVEFHHHGIARPQMMHSQPGNGRHSGPDEGFNRKSRLDDPSTSNDRKRPRHEDYPLDSIAKTSKPLEQGERVKNQSPDFESEMLNTSQSKSTQNITETVTSQQHEKTTHQGKSVLDNASDSILERAERLCKELREKREASSNQRVSLLKSQAHHSINDKMNNLKKNKQSYVKGHIRNLPADQASSVDSSSTKSTMSSASALSHRSKEPSSQSKQPSSTKVKTLDEIRKSIEQSVLDDTRSASSVVPQVDKNRSRVRASSLSETSSTLSPSAGHSKGRAYSVTGSDGKSSRPHHKIDSSSSGGPKGGSKQPITKENLNKMVNCPRSRTERLQLARMFQSRVDNKSSPQVSSRSNINLEGLYDSHDMADLEIEVGGNMPTIKLEELSDDIRSQILGLIQDDIGITQNSKQLHMEIIDIDGEEERTSGATSHKVVKNSAEEKSNKKSIQPKARNSKEISTDSTKPNSVHRESVSNPTFMSKTRKEGYAIATHCADQENSRSGLAKKSAVDGTKITQKTTADKVKSQPYNEESTSSSLTRDNVLSKYPTILGTMRTNSANTDEKGKSSLVDDGKDVDSGRSSMSMSSSSIPVSTTSSPIPSSSRSSLLSSLSSNPVIQPTMSMSSVLTSPTPIEEAVNILNSSPPILTSSSKEGRNDRFSTVSSLDTDVSSNTMSELLALSEQEESVKQEMMSMELRLTRLHRLLEQAVYQINKCTERRNELQDEEKSLTSRRLSLLREATSSQQESRSGTSTPSLATTAPSAQTNTDCNVTASERPSATELPSTLPQGDSDGPQSSLSRSEWLAKFSAFLPSNFISSSNGSSSRRLSPHSPTSEMGQSKNNHVTASDLSTTSTALDSTKARLSSDPALLQMVPERDLESTNRTESYVRFDSVNHPNSNEPSVSTNRDNASRDSMPAPNADAGGSATQEFTSPIMYVGTIKSGAGSGKSDKPAPVMMLNNATISSLFNGRCENLNPVKIVGLGEQGDVNSENTFPPVVRRPSVGSPRQEDSDIGSIASVASGSSLGEQISRYCHFTPGASADGRNPHDLSVILSGPSDTSDLRGLEDDDHFGNGQMRPDADDNSVCKQEKVMKLKEDVGNNRVYGRLDQDSIKSAEALHLIERNHDVPSSSADKKKKKRKTKQQRDSGIRGRPKPYVISSSSADERDTNKVVSNLEQRLRKSPNSTDDDSSDQPNTMAPSQSQESRLSPSKGDQGTEITIAECDSSTNLGMVDSQSLNDSSNRLKEMNESFEKTFGRKPRDRSFYKDFQNGNDEVVVLSDDNDQEGSLQKGSNSNVIDLCDDSDVQPSSLTVRNIIGSEKCSRYPSKLGPVCFIQCFDEKLYVGYLNNGFKVFDMKSEDPSSVRYYAVPKLTCLEVGSVRECVKVCAGSGFSVIAVNTKNDKRKVMDMNTTVKCLHILSNHLFAGLDTGEICVYDNKTWKETDRYICSDSSIQCMSSGSEGGTKVLCVASLDSTITVVDADRCLPLRMLTAHSKAALSVQVYGQYVYSCSGDSQVIIQNLHTARAEKVFKDNKGIVNSVFYSQGHLFSGGLDKLVRVYNVKSWKLVQVYYGAGMGAIKYIYVHQDKLLVTGNTLGSVDIVDLDLKAKNVCKHKNCGLNFGLASHLAWHIAEKH